MDLSDPHREALHDAIQQHAQPRAEDGVVLTGWALVAEWMDKDGERWLSRGHAAHTTSWGANGMYHEALFGEWPDGDEE